MRSHAMYTSFLNVCRQVILFTQNTRANNQTTSAYIEKPCADKITFKTTHANKTRTHACKTPVLTNKIIHVTHTMKCMCRLNEIGMQGLMNLITNLETTYTYTTLVKEFAQTSHIASCATYKILMSSVIYH